MSRFSRDIFPTNLKVFRYYKAPKGNRSIKVSVGNKGWIVEDYDKFGYKRFKHHKQSVEENLIEALRAAREAYGELEEVKFK